MPVCLHCGEVAPEGALFCGKCGYTLPQQGMETPSTPPTVQNVAPRATAAAGFMPAAAVVPPRVAPAFVPAGPYAAPVSSDPGAVGPIAPPPNAKYCTRCASLISSAAVYCPVCQQPQA